MDVIRAGSQPSGKGGKTVDWMEKVSDEQYQLSSP